MHPQLPLPDGAGLAAPAHSFRLSVVIPVYNERRWIREVVRRVQVVPVSKEIVIVDDASTDGTRDILRDLEGDAVRVVYQPRNRGKGAALREGFRHVTGDFVVVQDADLEYDPADYPRLLEPLLSGRADVVYGSRLLRRGWQGFRLANYLANRFLTALSNLFTGLHLTDMETCYKAFRREVLTDMRLKSDRFGFEPEFTARLVRRPGPAHRVCEVPVWYSGRSYGDGKKIGLRDGLNAIYCIVRYGLFD